MLRSKTDFAALSEAYAVYRRLLDLPADGRTDYPRLQVY